MCMMRENFWNVRLTKAAWLGGICLLLLTGCETPYGTPDRTATGALIGGAFGVATGALLGGRHAGESALIGGAFGAATGALIGHSMDEDARMRLRAEAPQTYVRVDQGQPLTVNDVKALSQARVSDDAIITEIQRSRSVFNLSAADIIDLKKAGVNERVIDFMINTTLTTDTNSTGSGPVVVDTPPVPQTETVGGSPGPDYVWVDGEWVWNGRWIWVAGHWMLPPYPHAIWYRGGWVHGPHGYRRVPGYWR